MLLHRDAVGLAVVRSVLPGGLLRHRGVHECHPPIVSARRDRHRRPGDLGRSGQRRTPSWLMCRTFVFQTQC